jgi:hypothetical protein
VRQRVRTLELLEERNLHVCVQVDRVAYQEEALIEQLFRHGVQSDSVARVAGLRRRFQTPRRRRRVAGIEVT